MTDAQNSISQYSPTGAGIPAAADQQADVPAYLSLWPALLAYPLLMLVLFINEEAYVLLIQKEGVIDYLTPAILLVGVAFGMRVLRQASVLPQAARWVRSWVLLVMAGMVFLAGEELSWGQHLGLWSAEHLPAWLKQVNDQHETNFHNLTAGGNSLEQAFKNLIYIGTLVGCLILPGLRRLRGKTLQPEHAAYWFWPTQACLPAAFGVLLIMFPNRIAEWVTGSKLSVLRHSEIHEFYIALMAMIYLASILWRLGLRRKLEAAQHKKRSEVGVGA